MKHSKILVNEAKLDEDTETLRHETVTYSFKLALQRARQAKKMTQKDLGSLLNEKGSVVNAYEAGSAIPDRLLVSKMERVLGCKLPRC